MTGLGDIRLYEAIGRMRETADQLQAERDQLKAENAKLRELCVGMWEYVKRYADTLDVDVHGYTWPYNTHGYGDKVRNGPGAFGGFPNRMRELGIEVDG